MITKFALLLAFFPFLGQAQDTLTLEQTVQIALEKNYSIRIAQKNQQISEMNVALGNAGFLPSVTANFNRSNNYFQTYIQERVNTITDSLGGTSTATTIQDFSNNTNSNFNYGVAFNWTIFDGLGMFIALDRLEELKAAGYEQAQATIETTVADVSNAYYNLIQLQERVEALTSALRISEQRLELAQAQFEVGSGSKLNFLAAQVDYNTDKSNLIRQQQAFENAKIALNSLLGRNPTTLFTVKDTIIVSQNLDLLTLQAQALESNPTILLAKRNKSISTLDRRLIQSQRLPQVNVFTGYTHNKQQNRASLLPNTNQSDAINYGISASLTIFNGFNLRRQIQTAQVTEDVRNLELDDLSISVEASIQRAFIDYKNALNLIELEKQNLEVARQNIEIALERYRLGVSTALELREVQRNAIDTESRLIDAEYSGKLAEIELKRLSSTIIQ